MCCLGLHARLHRDKCNAANLLTSLPYVPGVREIDGADRTTSFDRGSITSSSPAFLNQSFFFSPPFTRVQPLEIVSRFLFHRAEFIAHFKKLPKNFLPSILFIQGGILFLLVISQSCFFFFFFWRGGWEEEKHALFRSVNNGIASFRGERKRPFFLGRFSGDEIRLFGVSRHNRGRGEEKEKKGAIVRNGLEDI